MRFFQWLLAGLTIASLLYIISLNPQMAELKWMPGDQSEPLKVPFYMFIIFTFVAGYIVGLLYYWFGEVSHNLKTSGEIRQLKKQIKQLKDQICAETNKPEEIIQDQ